MDKDFRVIEDGAVVIEKNQIAAVGPDSEIAPQYPGARPMVCRGRAVMPGLINCHTHVPMALFRGLADDKELMDWLRNYIFPAEARCLNEEFVRVGSRLAFAEMLRGGTTSVVDMYMFENAVADEADKIGMRGVFGQAMIDFPTPDFHSWDDKVQGVKAMVKRWQGHSRIVPAIAPHSPYSVSPEHLQQTQRLADELDCPLVIHLAETMDEHKQVMEERGKSPVTYLHDLGLLTRRTVAAHMVWPSDEEIPLLAKGGVGVGHCPQSNAKLASGIAPVVKMLNAGVDVGLGTDGCASNNDLDMWQEMQTACFLQKLKCNDARVMTAKETLRLATSGAAKAAKLDHLVGSLEVGKRADLLVVNLHAIHQTPVYDPISQLAYTTKSTDVEWVFIDGSAVVAEGRVLFLDEHDLREQVAHQTRKVRETF